MSRLRLVLLLLALQLIVASFVEADESRLTKRHFTETQWQEIDIRAAEWELREDEWLRYQELMRGARGIWTPNVDPLTALGAHARSADERRRYAELLVRREANRVEGELAFQRAVTEAWQSLYPAQPRLRATPSPSRTLLSLEAGTPVRYGLVLEPDCRACSTALKSYLEQLRKNTSLEALDIYLRNTGGDDEVLQQWASANAVPVELVSATRITLNHGDQYEGGAPQVWALRKDGKWQSVR
ncbi:MAG: TIGR03759 family integrating conjugative element protein [Proteobacteria bacterium]|nr:TIGR03759 family integrating conjugative element protein [Pseudomonadota bacterium]